jgi:hypothetical protein
MLKEDSKGMRGHVRSSKPVKNGAAVDISGVFCRKSSLARTTKTPVRA